MSSKWDEYVERGATAFQEGKYSEAENFLHAALMEAETGQDEMQVALSLDNLAEVYFEQGKYDKAEPLYQRSLRIRERVLEPEHEDIVASLNNLSALYFFQEKHADAEPLCRQLTAIYEKVL
ncbi:MAG TPA: tetratricopeptide repeat protein, partial [Trichormus sp.]